MPKTQSQFPPTAWRFCFSRFGVRSWDVCILKKALQIMLISLSGYELTFWFNLTCNRETEDQRVKRVFLKSQGRSKHHGWNWSLIVSMLIQASFHFPTLSPHLPAHVSPTPTKSPGFCHILPRPGLSACGGLVLSMGNGSPLTSH